MRFLFDGIQVAVRVFPISSNTICKSFSFGQSLDFWTVPPVSSRKLAGNGGNHLVPATCPLGSPPSTLQVFVCVLHTLYVHLSLGKSFFALDWAGLEPSCFWGLWPVRIGRQSYVASISLHDKQSPGFTALRFYVHLLMCLLLWKREMRGRSRHWHTLSSVGFMALQRDWYVWRDGYVCS